MGAIVSLHGREFGFDTETGEIVRRGARGMGAVVEAASVVAKHYGGPVDFKTRLTLTDTPITVTDAAGSAQWGGSAKLFTFPKGLLVTKAARVIGSLTMGVTGTFIDAFTGLIALGTAAATVGTPNTLTTTEADILQSTVIAAATAKVASTPAFSIATALTESGGRVFDGTGTAKALYLNIVIDDDATHTSGTGKFTGTIDVLWSCLGLLPLG